MKLLVPILAALAVAGCAPKAVAQPGWVGDPSVSFLVNNDNTVTVWVSGYFSNPGGYTLTTGGRTLQWVQPAGADSATVELFVGAEENGVSPYYCEFSAPYAAGGWAVYPQLIFTGANNAEYDLDGEAGFTVP